MTDLTVPPAARRFASLLDREYCFWMPSPSVALLSALVTAKERPKRLLGPEDLPAFVSNVGRVAGAATVSLAPAAIDQALRSLVDVDSLSPGQIWGVAWHRDGKLSPTDWLAGCAAVKVPTIELCLGSLASLAQWGSFPATFTIVDLDAEASFAGVRLTALLTNDRGLAARVRHLCLPGPEARDYILDASPRGLAQDEPDLLSIVEEAAALFGGKAGASGAAAGRAVSWWKRLRSGGQDSNPPAGEVRGSAPLPKWSSRLAEIEERHAEVLRTATAFAESLKARLEQQTESAAEWQRRCLEAESAASARAETIDRWEARFEEAETEAEKDAAVLSRVRDESARQKTEFESALASLKSERAALEQTLARTEEERALALGTAAAAELRITGELGPRIKELEEAAAAAADSEVTLARAAQSQREALEQRLARMEEAHALALKDAAAAELRITSELRQGIRELEEARDASADREAKQNQAAESARAGLKAIVARLEAEAAAAATERSGLLSALSATKAEREALEQKAARAEAEHVVALRNAAASEMRIALELRQRVKELEESASASADREAKQAHAAASERAGLQRALDSLMSERTALEQKVARAEADHVLALRNAAAAEMRVSIELRQRITELEATGAAATDREAKQARAAASERAALEQKVARAEAKHTLALKEAGASETRINVELRQRIQELEAAGAASAEREATRARSAESMRAGLQKAKEDAERSLAASEDERKALTRKLAELDAELGEALSESARQSAEQRGTIEEQSRRVSKLESEAAERERTLQSAVEAQRRRVEELEQAAAALTNREAVKVAEGESSKSGLVERIRRLEADADLVQQAFARFRDEKKTVDRALAQAIAEGQSASERIAAAEIARDLALATAKRREEAHRAVVEEMEQRAVTVRREVEAAAERESKQAELREASRAELVVRLARLEAAEVAAEKARGELLNRKLETERALEAAEAQVAALNRRLATAKLDSEPSPPAAGPLPSADPENGGKPVNTGGFSSLLKVLQTSVIQRPERSGPEGKDPDWQVNQPFEYEANPDETLRSSPSAPDPDGEPPGKAPEVAAEPTTGGFSALLDRLTGRTKRPRPTPPPDESEKLGGWLRDQGGRKRDKE